VSRRLSYRHYGSNAAIAFSLAEQLQWLLGKPIKSLGEDAWNVSVVMSNVTRRVRHVADAQYQKDCVPGKLPETTMTLEALPPSRFPRFALNHLNNRNTNLTPNLQLVPLLR